MHYVIILCHNFVTHIAARTFSTTWSSFVCQSCSSVSLLLGCSLNVYSCWLIIIIGNIPARSRHTRTVTGEGESAIYTGTTCTANAGNVGNTTLTKWSLVWMQIIRLDYSIDIRNVGELSVMESNCQRWIVPLKIKSITLTSPTCPFTIWVAMLNDLHPQ